MRHCPRDEFAAGESKCLDSGAIKFPILQNGGADTWRAETEFHGVRTLPFEFVCLRAVSGETPGNLRASLSPILDRLLFWYHPRVSHPPKSNTLTDPMMPRIRKLAQQRHAQSVDRAQMASQREFARQEREDKVIAEFLEWNPPGNIWRM